MNRRRRFLADRRTFLIGAPALGLSFALPASGSPPLSAGPKKRRSLITLWLDGGPSQLETWDPHPGTSIGGPTRAIATSVPGCRIAAHYPRLADRMHHLAVIRSLVSKEGDHERASYLLKTGYRPDPTVQHPSLGSMLARETADKSLEIPAFVSLGFDPFPCRGGFLGSQFDAFQYHDVGALPPNLQPRVGADRQQRRLEILAAAGRAFATGRKSAAAVTTHDSNLAAALRIMSSAQLRAFDLSQESQSTRETYGDSAFGRGCLTARRLVEEGVPAVHVSLQNFDSHDDNFTVHRNNARLLDRAMAALIDDLRKRELWESTLVLCLGEFGRTPKINARDGRDHWPNGFSCLIGGAELAAGVVIGATDPEGKAEKPQDPVEIPDLYATILNALGVDFSQEVLTPIGRPMRLASGQPIARLMR